MAYTYNNKQFSDKTRILIDIRQNPPMEMENPPKVVPSGEAMSRIYIDDTMLNVGASDLELINLKSDSRKYFEVGPKLTYPKNKPKIVIDGKSYSDVAELGLVCLFDRKTFQ